MTRPSFLTSLYGYVKYTDSSGSGSDWYPDCKRTTENVTGVSRRKPKGWIPPTGYHLYRSEIQRAYGSSHVLVLGSNWTRWDGYVGAMGRFNSLNHFDEILDEGTAMIPMSTSAALVAARNKLKDQKVNLGVAFAERAATSRMLGDTARRLVRSVRELRSGNFRNAARALGIVNDPGRPRGSNWTNHWLQLQYGWKPLLSDVYGSCDALAKREQSDWRVTVKASRRDSDFWKKERFPLGTTHPNRNFDACRLEVRRDRRVFVRIDAIPENDLTMSFASLGLTNPLEVAWEVVPYSFVVDWFLPLGDWLSSLDALLGYNSCWTSVTTRNEAWWTDVGLSRTDYTLGGFVKNDWLGTKRVLEVTRTAYSSTPLASFPEFKDPRSLGHMANGLSLLAQAFAR